MMDKIAEVYEKWVKFDAVLTDRERLGNGPRNQALWDMWDAIKANVKSSERTCTWTEFAGWDEQGNYDTECGTAFAMFEDKPPNDMDYFYCPSCGGKIVTVRQVQKPAEEEAA